MAKAALTLVAFLALAPVGAAQVHAQPSPAAAPPPCQDEGTTRYVCNVQVVEDMAVVPGGRWVLGGAMTPGAAGLYLIDTQTLKAKPAAIVMGSADKAFDECPGPPDMTKIQTHGIDLKPGPGMTGTVYAVNHGGRESLEIFKIDAAGAGDPKITWTGCLLMPKNASGNAVVGLSDGRIAVTKFADADDKDSIVHILSGQITGAVYIWTPGQGFKELPGARFSGDNGLVVGKTGKFLYVNDYGHKAVYKVPLDGSGKTEHVDTAFRPDNLRWAPDGKIIATGQFIELSNRPDLHGWAAVKIDPETMKAEPYLKVAGSKAFDNGTTTLIVGKQAFIGTYRGDRVEVLPAP